MRKSIFILLCLWVVCMADAQNIIHPKIAGPNGLWVNSYNGVLFFAQTDMETQNSVMPMQLRFYYNSSDSTDYGYGRGFTLGYEMTCTVDEDGNVMITQGDGRSDTYMRYGEEYQSPPGVFSQLSHPDADSYLLTTKEGEEYEFTRKTMFRISLPIVRPIVIGEVRNVGPKLMNSGTTIDSNSISVEGRPSRFFKLSAMVDRHGNRTELTYNEERLVKIQDAVGHTINLSYQNGHLTSATSSFYEGTYTYAYDSKKQLVKRTDGMGNSTLYGYDREYHINEITDANGNKTLISYNGVGMVSRLKTDVSDKSIRYDGDKTVFIDYTQPKNLYSYYRWDDYGRVIEKVGLCCGIQQKMEYDEDDNVIKRTDANGHTTTYTYDDRGNMLSMTDAKGNTERYTYDDVYNNVTSFTDRNGNYHRLTYNDKGDLTELSGPMALSYKFTYNERGWALTATDPKNNVTTTTYNEDGTTKEVMDAAGNITTYDYDNYGQLRRVTDPRHFSTSLLYNKNGWLRSVTDHIGHTMYVTRDKVGQVVRLTNAKNQITAYTYDPLGNVLSRTDALSGETRMEYDGRGNIIGVTDPLGRKQTMTYDERGKLHTQTNAAGETTTYDYDAKGNLIAVFQPNGNTMAIEYDENDQPIQVSDNLGMIAQYTYDANGNMLTMTDGEGRTVSYTYDSRNRMERQTLPSGNVTRYAYDLNSNLTSVIDANGSVTRNTYSSLDQLLSTTDALNAKTQYEYDGNGNLTKAIDAKGNATTYHYDALNQLSFIVYAEGLQEQYTYDEVGNMVEETDRAGRKTKMTYDALGRLLSQTYADNTSDRYTYDAAGQLLSAINNAATVHFIYDDAGRILTETLNGKTTSYSYSIAAGKRIITYPSGMKVTEMLNGRDLISSILQNGTEVVTMAYNAAGQKTRQTYANGISTDYDYNENGWLSQIKASQNVMHLNMVYDALGNMTSRTDQLNSERTESYGYDLISQLTSFKRGTSVENTYRYDLLGNRVQTLENSIQTTYHTNNINAYTSVSGRLNMTPQYDDNGNLTRETSHKYGYDCNNRLISVDDISAQYRYDALGRRVSKTLGGVTTNYYYAGNQMVEEYNGQTLVASYLFGNDIDEALQMKRGNNTYYYHANHLGSVMALTDSESHIAERIEYDAFGTPSFFDTSGNALTNSAIGNNILFTGREWDAESHTYYFRARTQNPALGRFMQKDPLGYVDGMNDYAYVRNNSIIMYDVTGNRSVRKFKIPKKFRIAKGKEKRMRKAIRNGNDPNANPIQDIYDVTDWENDMIGANELSQKYADRAMNAKSENEIKALYFGYVAESFIYVPRSMIKYPYLDELISPILDPLQEWVGEKAKEMAEDMLNNPNSGALHECGTPYRSGSRTQ